MTQEKSKKYRTCWIAHEPSRHELVTALATTKWLSSPIFQTERIKLRCARPSQTQSQGSKLSVSLTDPFKMETIDSRISPRRARFNHY